MEISATIILNFDWSINQQIAKLPRANNSLSMRIVQMSCLPNKGGFCF
jgi:hypothetical protein